MKNNALFITIFLITAVLTGCEKGDSSTDFGYTYVYMPEATSGGGTDQNFTVPSTGTNLLSNFEIDSVNHKLNIILGVTRSGEQASGGYSVDVTVNKDTTGTIVSNTDGTVILPDNLYSLPSKVTVSSGQTSGTFYLSVDATALKSAVYNGKKLVLAVKISNPTNYTLSAKLSQTIVIIDYDKILNYLK